MASFEALRRSINVQDTKYDYFCVNSLDETKYGRLPFSIRVLLESAVRNCDDFSVSRTDVDRILNWEENTQSKACIEIPFKPARVLMQDFTGVPGMVDLAAMRDAMKRLGGDPERINPLVPVDLVVDHSIQVDAYALPEAAERNQDLEFTRNHERFVFLKWGSKAFENFLIVPPGTGIVHQVNLEHLARVVFSDGPGSLIYPDTLVGTDSHTTMVNGLGCLGWGVGGIEAEAAMLGQPMSMVLPKVVGVQLIGSLLPQVTSTDLVLTITQALRAHGVVDKFVEFWGTGVRSLSLADRATIANMAPEYGATCGFFPVDDVALDYLRQTGRDEHRVKVIEAGLRALGLFQDYTCAAEPAYSERLQIDLSTVVPCVAGPKRPQDKVPLADMQKDFQSCLATKAGHKGFGIPADALKKKVPFEHEGREYALQHGSVVLAAITSCTNTSNPSAVLAAALLCKSAVEAGLSVAPYIKTSFSPGSRAVSGYLAASGLQPYLDALRFHVVGYGCATCIGNSGDLPESVSKVIQSEDLVAAAVLSGNRNFEARIHPLTRANYIASPPLVVAFALAGTVDIDFETTPLGKGKDGRDVFLRDIWPSREEVQRVVSQHVTSDVFTKLYRSIQDGSPRWNALDAPEGTLYPWDEKSTYISNPPFFRTMGLEPEPIQSIANARVLLNFGDSVTTDHISPAGSISLKSSAAKWLTAKGISPRDFNTYGARRGNDEVMTRGTFANTRIFNKTVGEMGPKTLHVPSNQVLDIFDVAKMYMAEGVPQIILAGAEYGSGSSRDWAAKGPYLLGVKAVIAVSYERIHRSNLVGMGIIPLQFRQGESADSLGITGKEQFHIDVSGSLVPGQEVSVRVTCEDRRSFAFSAILRVDTDVELAYVRHGGILPFVLRQLLANCEK